MKQLDILNHLGLGDHLITNGLTRFYANLYEKVRIPCYSHNYNSVSFMFRDNKKIEIHPVESSEEAIEYFAHPKALRLGFYSTERFNRSKFDEEFYRQANVPFEYRWKLFHVDLPEEQVEKNKKFAFMHEDFGRGFMIRKEKIQLEIVTPLKGGQFFDNYNIMKSCDEIHCINSSFLHFWDSVPDVEGQKLFYHKYARRGDEATLKKNWEIIK